MQLSFRCHVHIFSNCICQIRYSQNHWVFLLKLRIAVVNMCVFTANKCVWAGGGFHSFCNLNTYSCGWFKHQTQCGVEVGVCAVGELTTETEQMHVTQFCIKLSHKEECIGKQSHQYCLIKFVLTIAALRVFKPNLETWIVLCIVNIKQCKSFSPFNYKYVEWPYTNVSYNAHLLLILTRTDHFLKF